MTQVLSAKSAAPRLSADQILQRLGGIVAELANLNNCHEVKAVVDQVECLRYLTRKLRYDTDIQNAAAEAALWTKHRLGELLPIPQTKGGNRRAISNPDIVSFSQKAKEIGIPQAEASRCAELARVPREEFAKHVSAFKQEGELSTTAILRHLTALRRGSRNPDGIQTPPLPSGVFDLIYADPPWEYASGISSRCAVERHYPTLSLEQLSALTVPEFTAPQAMLFLWTTSPMLPDALKLIEMWGFSYRSSMVWIKDKLGMGFYARINHEFLLIGRKGDFPAPDTSVRPASVIKANKGRHSEKPACVYDMLERMYPAARKLELFARQTRSGWQAWGNEITSRRQEETVQA